MDIAIQIAYLVAAILFVLGIKMLGRIKSARRGNIISSIGMFIAVLATVIQVEAITLIDILISVLIGSAIGLIIAFKVKMTKVPEMVALFNGFGGIASLGVAFADFWLQSQEKGLLVDNITGISVAISILIGGLTFTGSIVAFLKLNGSISGKAITFRSQHFINLVLLIAVIVLIVFALVDTTDPLYMILVGALSLVLGILLVIPIGGADMPVVISLLNSYSGMAAAAAGFVLSNTALIVSGALVGAAGLILTMIMCEAMNRSLLNVLLGGFGGDSSGDGAGASLADGQSVTETTADDVAILMSYARQVVIVPGYGMAVAQAQHQVRELADVLAEKGVTVKYAIHSVAGRMPGHMNVLLAEANVAYDHLYEMDDINNEFSMTDVSLVIGANDVVNPAARTDKSSPIYGMPILNVDQSQTTIVLKRSMRPGYSGIENELFYKDNTRMLFGDARESVQKLIQEVKAL